jgi:hypothetical protein
MYICRDKLKFCCFNNEHISTVSPCFTHCFILSSVTTYLGCFLFMLSDTVKIHVHQLVCVCMGLGHHGIEHRRNICYINAY